MSNPCMLEKDCTGILISTFPPCYAFQMIFTDSSDNSDNRASSDSCDSSDIRDCIAPKTFFIQKLLYKKKK